MWYSHSMTYGNQIQTLSIHMSVALSVCYSIWLLLCQSVCLSASPSVSLSVGLPTCLSLYLSVSQAVCLSLCFSLCLCVCICLPVFQSIRPSFNFACPFNYPSLRLSIWLYVRPSVCVLIGTVRGVICAKNSILELGPALVYRSAKSTCQWPPPWRRHRRWRWSSPTGWSVCDRTTTLLNFFASSSLTLRATKLECLLLNITFSMNDIQHYDTPWNVMMC